MGITVTCVTSDSVSFTASETFTESTERISSGGVASDSDAVFFKGHRGLQGRQQERATGRQQEFGTPQAAKTQERFRETGKEFSTGKATGKATGSEEVSTNGLGVGSDLGVAPVVVEPTTAGGSVFLRKGQNQDI